MLFGYPIEAVTNNNWLHECLVEILSSLHDDIRLARVSPEWPDIIPEQFRERLKNRDGLRDRLETYRTELSKLSQIELNLVYQALIEQNQIAELLSSQCDCQIVSDLPPGIQSSTRDLFHFAFTLLTSLGIRDEHYKVIHTSLGYHVCPFCGCEYFDAPQSRREALDHFLPESAYPLAAANLHNLVPMGDKCNSGYKRDQDLLWGNDGRRRKAFNPYRHQGVKVSLENSVPFAGRDGKLPNWVIDFEPDCEEVSTWNEVFRVRERFVRDVLDVLFMRWLADFASWYCSTRVDYPPDDVSELTDAIQRYAVHLEDHGFRDRMFLKAATFRMLQKQCQLGNQRLVGLITGIVTARMQK